ncbi:unnamed protein product [Prunus armeniaca]|uniref:Ubiquitin-like domain-containing protein n=1 Tax=Prunus armeniaca TaxID=36596 RepID=A0A6J5UJM9_PRUAR|nr:unnamed protein product [Prunus armeniaca]
MPEEDLVELKFRLYDGSDIGPFRYSPASTVAMLKERIVAEWPKDKKIAPKGANDIKLINAGKILENNKTVGQCRAPFGELPRGIITMHVVVQPSVTKAKTAAKMFCPGHGWFVTGEEGHCLLFVLFNTMNFKWTIVVLNTTKE